jgi:CRISPR/Cas system endoribonuclease Cas6 (RAMP superfamily)
MVCDRMIGGVELWPSSGILKTRKHSVSELDLFPSSGVGIKTSTLLGPFKRANLNHWSSD